MRFGRVWEREEGCGGGEHCFDFREGDRVVDESEESVGFGGGDELRGYFWDAVGEVV